MAQKNTSLKCGILVDAIKKIRNHVIRLSFLYLIPLYAILFFVQYSIILWAIIILMTVLSYAILMLVMISHTIKNDTISGCLYRNTHSKIKNMYDKLEVAKKLQVFAEPGHDLLTGNKDLRFTYKMIPADSISGDIFGIHNNSDKESLFWVGDVIGHGIDAGLVMVSIQSIIQTLMIKNSSDPLKELLVKLNKILSDVFDINLAQPYHTSFIILKYINNSIKFAGQHENIIHFNNTKKYLTTIDTHEFGINLGTLSSSNDIEKFIEYGIFEFSQGDSLVLYSDGITEALNDKGQMFGLSRLLELLEDKFKEGSDPENIIIDIITELKLWNGPSKFHDDITLIIITNIGTKIND